MAEINVERKKNVWPWIVGLIVLLLAIWGVMELMDNDERRAYSDPALGRTSEPVTTPATQPATTARPAPATTPADTATTGDAADTTDTTTPSPPPER